MAVTERAALGGAGVFGATGVALAAYAAHAGTLDARHAAILQRGIEMQMWHALALLGASRVAGLAAGVAVWGFLVGTVLFCAAVDSFAFGADAIVRVAPFGGSLLILSWILLAVGALRRRR